MMPPNGQWPNLRGFGVHLCSPPRAVDLRPGLSMLLDRPSASCAVTPLESPNLPGSRICPYQLPRTNLVREALVPARVCCDRQFVTQAALLASQSRKGGHEPRRRRTAIAHRHSRPMKRKTLVKPLAGIGFVILLAALYWLLHETGALAIILDGAALREQVSQIGVWGPLAVIGLMTFAILVSPIPSAPIALAAGAVYGHTWGTVYVLLGAEAGAIAAFGLARLLGYEVLRRWFGDRLSLGLLGSQVALMGIVFVSRLLPFVSFDLVSYAAGLTVLSFWRFALATLAGIVPASFLLAHFGREMATGEAERIMISVLALGGITLIPVIAKLTYDRFRERTSERRSGSEKGDLQAPLNHINRSDPEN